MTDSKPRSEPLLAAEIRAQAASLAAHLGRCGVQWLPKPRAEAVESLVKKFAQPAVSADSPSLHSVPSPGQSSRLQASTEQASSAQGSSAQGSSAQGTDLAKSSAAAGASNGDRSTPIQPATRLDSVASVGSFDQPYAGPAILGGERQAHLQVIRSEVSNCSRCEILSSCRTKTVFGEGSVSPRVVFFGEGPGAEEDRTGRPFVGKAGDLLTKMIEACTFEREDVYILNTVKCRPPGNRNPELDEIENCREYYQRQLAILRPEYIVCLGAISSQELLRSKLSVGRLRGKFHRYFESKVLVTYHPAYLLRNPAAKKAAWTDLQFMLRDAGIQLG